MVSYISVFNKTLIYIALCWVGSICLKRLSYNKRLEILEEFDCHLIWTYVLCFRVSVNQATEYMFMCLGSRTNIMLSILNS